MSSLVVAITGASGVVYGKRLVEWLVENNRPVDLVISETAKLVIQEELGFKITRYHEGALENLFGPSAASFIKIHSARDFSAPIASGSYPASGMVIIPCSMGTLGSIASGVSQNLIHRAADCALKENRKLILVPRETPLSAIHLENMLKLTKMGARMVAAMPGFYSGARSVDEIVDFLVGKVLDQLEIPHTLYPRWTGKKSTVPESF